MTHYIWVIMITCQALWRDEGSIFGSLQVLNARIKWPIIWKDDRWLVDVRISLELWRWSFRTQWAWRGFFVKLDFLKNMNLKLWIINYNSSNLLRLHSYNECLSYIVWGVALLCGEEDWRLVVRFHQWQLRFQYMEC